MSEGKEIGPKVNTTFSCYGCSFCVSESYHVQSDSGFDIYCTHGGMKKDIGNGSWDTPDWCPFRPSPPMTTPQEPGNEPSLGGDDNVPTNPANAPQRSAGAESPVIPSNPASRACAAEPGEALAAPVYKILADRKVSVPCWVYDYAWTKINSTGHLLDQHTFWSPDAPTPPVWLQEVRTAPYPVGNLAIFFLRRLAERDESQSDLAKRWGKSRQYVSKLLNSNDDSTWTIKTMQDLFRLTETTYSIIVSHK